MRAGLGGLTSISVHFRLKSRTSPVLRCSANTSSVVSGVSGRSTTGKRERGRERGYTVNWCKTTGIPGYTAYFCSSRYSYIDGLGVSVVEYHSSKLGNTGMIHLRKGSTVAGREGSQAPPHHRENAANLLETNGTSP